MSWSIAKRGMLALTVLGMSVPVTRAADALGGESGPVPTAVPSVTTDESIIPVSGPSDDVSTLPAVIEASQHFAKIARLVTPSLVHIQSHRTGRGGGTIEETGSGVLMRSEELGVVYAVTNQHVINGAELDDIEIKLFDGRVIRPSEKLEDIDTDVAVLKLKDDRLQTARWGDSNSLDIGHMVLAMGSPFGLSKSITFGIISAKGRRSLNLGSTRNVLNQDFLQTDAAINPGNSGGPLIDMYGRIVGINTAIASSSGGNEGIGFSIPSNLVYNVVNQLLAHGYVQRAYLGVMLDKDFNDEKAHQYNLERQRGARVVKVLPQSPAADAGQQVDDLILSFDGRDIEDESHLIHLVSLTELNRTVRVVIIRGGRRETIMVRLTDRTKLGTQSALPQDLRMAPTDGPIENVGLTVHEVDHDLGPQLGLSETTRGVVVMSLPGGKSQHDSLQLYDVITEVSRQPIGSVEEFSAIVSAHKGNGPLLLRVRRHEHGQSIDQLLLWRQ